MRAPVITRPGRPKPRSHVDPELAEIAAFVAEGGAPGPAVWGHARRCFLDAVAGGLLALNRPACFKQLGGPPAPASGAGRAARVLGTTHLIDLEKASHDTSLVVRWLDVDDGWLTVEQGHAADAIGAILPAADLASRRRAAAGEPGVPMRALLLAIVDAHEIQRALCRNDFDRTEVHHLVLTRISATALSAHLLGATEEQVLNAVTHAWADGQGTFAQRPELDSATRMAQAAGDAASRASRAILRALRGEEVPALVRAAPRWGLYDVLCQSGRFRLERHPATWAIEHVVPKLGVSAEYQALTAAECAAALGPEVRARLAEVERVEVFTHEPAIRHLSRPGPLGSPAERRRSLEYVVASALLRGEPGPGSYDDAAAADPRLEPLRARVRIAEDRRLTAEHFDPSRRALGNALRVVFAGGGATRRVGQDYPLGHVSRALEGEPELERRFRGALRSRYPSPAAEAIWERLAVPADFESLEIHRFMDLLAR